MNVEWREVKTHPDYIVSSDGQVGSRWLGKLRILKGSRDPWGYTKVTLCDGHGGQKSVFVHVLVAEAFLGPRPTPAHQTNHKNGVKTDPRVENLEWVTASQNNYHRFSVLKCYRPRGEASGKSKVTEIDVREIRRRCAAGETHWRVASDYGVSRSSVSMIVTGKNWAWLK